MFQERIMSTRIIFAIALAVVLVGAALPLAAKTEPAAKPVPAVTHNTWTSGTPMPVASSFEAMGVVKGEIYVVGGYTASEAIANTQIYNPATNTWSTGPDLPTATGQAASAVVKNVLYVIGGSHNGGGNLFNAVWAYNTKTKSWTSKAVMPTARASAAASVEKNIIYVIGGYASGVRLNTV